MEAKEQPADNAAAYLPELRTNEETEGWKRGRARK